MNQIDVICVGDVGSDTFIRLAGDRIVVEEASVGRWLKFPFGEKVTFEHCTTIEAGGNAANAAVGLARLGVATALASHVGGDEVGVQMRAALHTHGVDARFMRVDPGIPSNRNFVLWFGDDRTILVHHESFDYHWPHLRPAEVPKWLYLSTVGNEALTYYEQIAEWLDTEPSVRLAFQPGTLQIKQGTKALSILYDRASLLICNREEATEISGGDHDDVGDLVERLHRLGPDLVIVTDGPAGAFGSDGELHFAVPPYPDDDLPLERTGAGDAFSSGLLGALVKGRALEEALTWGAINAMQVVQHVGSQTGLLGTDDIANYLQRAPVEFTVTEW